jgi:branched-chain amino acid transport system permease protein
MLTVLFAPSGVIGILRGEVDATDIRENVRALRERFDLR